MRARRALRKRDDILQAGLKVFAAKGFTAATMDDIALELDATKGLLYYHFKTKDELLREILERNDLTSGFENVIDGLEGGPLRHSLFEVAERVTALFDANRELTRFLHMHALQSGSEASVIYREVFARLYTQICLLLEGFQDRGMLRNGVPTMGAAHVVANVLLSDIAERFVFGAKHDNGDDYIARTLDILLLGLEPASRN